MLNFREDTPWSSWAMKFCVAVLAFAIGIAVYRAWSVERTPPTPPPPPPPPPAAIDVSSADPGTIKRAILEAKVRGENKIEIGVIACGRDIGSLRSALASDTVVLAELVGKKTYADPFGLHTWYRFKLRETLVEHPLPRFQYSPFSDGPSDMLPIAEDEFLTQESNGQMEIDGVTITQGSNGPRYREGQTYLIFLSIDPSKRTAIRSGSDPVGVFLVDSDGNLTSYVDEPHPFKAAVEKRFQNSVHNMREALKKR